MEGEEEEEENHEEQNRELRRNAEVNYFHGSILHINRPRINMTFSLTTRSQRVPETSH